VCIFVAIAAMKTAAVSIKAALSMKAAARNVILKDINI
jgi:hypothetical protein